MPPFFYGDTSAMNNKLISTIMMLSVMWILVKVGTKSGMVYDNEQTVRFINKASCVKWKKKTNATLKKIDIADFRYECVSAKNYIPPVPWEEEE